VTVMPSRRSFSIRSALQLMAAARSVGKKSSTSDSSAISRCAQNRCRAFFWFAPCSLERILTPRIEPNFAVDVTNPQRADDIDHASLRPQAAATTPHQPLPQ